MKKLSLLFSLVPIVFANAQNLDSLYNQFLRYKGLSPSNEQQNVSIQSEPIKCGFGIVNQVKLNYDRFTVQQKKVVGSLLQRPPSDTSFVTPKGWFRIHFNKSGYNAPLYNLGELAKAADSAYTYEVNVLGFPPPPKDSGEGGDDRYDIYIQNLTSNSYGSTELEKLISDITYISYMVIDNDFGDGVHSHGIDGARVTLAHEFHHAIQIGNYGYFENDTFYHEVTSTSMEEFVFPDVDDYVYEVATYFRNPQKSFSSRSIDDGYSRAIWNLFLRKQFGVDIIKRIWELMPHERALDAMSVAILEKGSSFKTEFNFFGMWTYFTGVRTDPSKNYFEDAAKFPLINPMVLTNSMTVNSEPVSNNFFQYNDFTSTKKDSVITLVTNCDVQGATSSPNIILPFIYALSTQQINGGKKIAEGFYSKLESSKMPLLSESNVLTGSMSVEVIDYAYPQPFRYSEHSQLFIPVDGIKGETVQLSIFSVDMNLVYSSPKRVLADQLISWDVLDQTGKKLNTGVYLYVTQSGDSIKKGKFVVYND